MAESIQKEIDTLSRAISLLEQALPLIITPSQFASAIDIINQAADIFKESKADPSFPSLSTTVKILNNGESAILSNVIYQSFILEILELLTITKKHIEQKGMPKSTNIAQVQQAGEFLIRITGRITSRYKLRVTFNPEYEAKAIRAFMLIKELQPFVRFLSLSPDISSNQKANLDNGFELDILSMEKAVTLHKLAGSVLEVINVQIFTETRNTPVMVLDPPSNAFDTQVSEFLAN